MKQTKIWYFVIKHCPFEDGTPRHELLRVRLDALEIDMAKDILSDVMEYGMSDDGEEVYALLPTGEKRAEIAELLQYLSIVHSIYVEYYIVRREKA